MPPDEGFTVLLVAADAGFRQAIRTALRATGFHFEEAGSGLEAVQRVLRGSYHLVLIALEPRGLNGFEICRNLRAASPQLGIVLMRSGATPEDEILAIDAGADDCVAVPFRFRAVVGRLGAVLRRPAASPAPDTSILRAGTIRLDLIQRIVWRANKRVPLSDREFDLLAALMKQRGNSITHFRLLVAVWGTQVKHGPEYLRAYIKSLRRKIENDPTHPEYVITVPWVGYMFHAPMRAPRGMTRLSGQ